MRMLALVLTVMAAVLPMAPASPQDKVNPPPKNQAEESAKKVKELQKERIATLKQMAVLVAKQFQMGQGTFEELLEAQLLIFEAELDAAEKESDRITVYKNTVELLKQYEDIAKRKVEFAKVPASSVLKVHARRLEAEINLERAKAKEAKKAK